MIFLNIFLHFFTFFTLFYSFLTFFTLFNTKKYIYDVITIFVDAWLNSSKINIITPTESLSRGCQISIEINDANKKFHENLTNLGVITDWRDPNVIRCAPTPLYNTFEEVYLLIQNGCSQKIHDKQKVEMGAKRIK